MIYHETLSKKVYLSTRGYPYCISPCVCGEREREFYLTLDIIHKRNAILSKFFSTKVGSYVMCHHPMR
jgi:hypothetical protein